MHKTVFWFLIAITIVSLILQMSGYNLTETIITVLIIDLIALGAVIEIERRKPKEIETGVITKVENIERICQDLSKTKIENPSTSIEEKLKKQKEDINYLLDKMARKTLELEEKINRFGLNLASHIENFGERIEKIEGSKKIENKEEKSKEESFSVGELVYLDEE
jgi:hypothetical protein